MFRAGTRYWPIWIVCGLVVALAAWARPRRIEGLSTLDGRYHWPLDAGAPARQFAWQPAEEMRGLLPARDPPDEISHPSLAEDGRTLFLTVRRGRADADIYRSQWLAGRWQPAEAVTELNTPWDEVGVAVSADGRQLVLASNRRGGKGGFDLYFSQRRKAGWGVPTNLGNAVNTPASETDPALSPDGQQIYFVRSHVESDTTDLYVAHRDAANKAWLAAPVAAANSSDNERSPCLGEGGGVLYFASDRALQGEGRNFDLFRLRLSDPKAAVEDLGRGINTPANEMDLAVVPDGFHLVFARTAADAPSSIYRSRLAEVRPSVVWDNSRWHVLRVLWWKAGLAAALSIGFLAGMYYAVGWLRRSASLGRFLAASLLVHVVVLWLLVFVPLSQEIIRRVDEIRTSQEARELYDDNLHQSHETGEQAYEKVADLKSVEAVETPAVARHTIAPANVPLHAEQLAPTLPAELVRQLPADRVIFVPPMITAPKPAPETARRAEPGLKLADVAPLTAEPPQKVAMPEVKALEEAVEQERVAAAMITLPTSPPDDPARIALVPTKVVAQPLQPAAMSLPSSSPPVAIRRSVPAPPSLARAADEEPLLLSKVGRAAEQVAAPAKIELPFDAPATPAPPTDTLASGGPRQADNRELIVGTLAKKVVEAPPALNPLATQLQRPAARATPVALAEDNVGMQTMFALRQGDTRREFIDLVGGNAETEAAVERGLAWLVEHQYADGHWSLHQLDPPEKKLPATSGPGNIASDTAATGLGLLPFLGGGHTHLAGDYQAVVAKAVAWLVEHQKPDGNLFTDAPSNAFMYSHGIASIALCEAYGLSQDVRLREPAQRALKFIMAAQHAGTGGWRYRPGEPGDTSVVGWQVMALKSGEMAGLEVPKASLTLAEKWLTSAAGSGGSLGTFGYQGPGGNPAMTAEGLLCRQFLGARRNDPFLLAGANYLLRHLPQNGAETSYYWYYATQVMYHMQGDFWTAWNERLRDLLVSTQIKDGHQSGTWDPRDSWEQSGGRLYATSLRLLMLEVYYRHLQLYQQWE